MSLEKVLHDSTVTPLPKIDRDIPAYNGRNDGNHPRSQIVELLTGRWMTGT